MKHKIHLYTLIAALLTFFSLQSFANGDDDRTTSAGYCYNCKKATQHKRQVTKMKIPAKKKRTTVAKDNGPAVKGGKVDITISVATSQMTVRRNGKVINTYAIGTGGKKGQYTPRGSSGRVLSLEPVHYSKSFNNYPLKHAMRLIGGIFIHAGNSMGKGASHGCIHLKEPNARALFQLVRSVGMKNASFKII